MNWLIINLIKEAKNRRFQPNDSVRYFTEPRKGKGKGIVLTPRFSKGVVVDYDQPSHRYKIRTNNDGIVDVHPRNIFSDSARTTSFDMPNIDLQPPKY